MRHGAFAVAALCLALACVAAPPTAAGPQAQKAARVGLLFDDAVSSESLRQGLRDLGYVEGKTIVFEERAPVRGNEQWSTLVAELIALKVDVLVTRNTPATVAARRATTTIPIVMAGVGDPLRTGLVSSLAHPRGNVTGVAFPGAALAAKRLEILRETVPDLGRVAVHWNPSNPTQVTYFAEAQAGARALGLKLHSVEIRRAEDVTAAFTALRRARPSALLVTGDPVIQRHIDEIVAFAATHRLPAMYNARENVDAGGLMSYGASRPDIGRRAATYIDKILKGAAPGALPVEEPATYELAINAKTARALGLTIPRSVLLRTDHLIE